MIGTVLVIILILLLLGAFPGPHNAGWNSFGYGPSGVIGIVLIVVLILLLMGRI